MPVELLLAPVGAGKTHTALQRLMAQKQADAFSRVWVLLASNRQEDAFRQRLLEQDPRQRIYVNIEFFNFYGLYARLLHSVSTPPRRLHDVARRDTGRYSLLRALAGQLHEDKKLRVFGDIAQTAGFVSIAADFIYELKQNLIAPEEFQQVAYSDKDADLAALYSAYQRKLQAERVVDRDGEGWLALALAQDMPELGSNLNIDLLIVDGYDQFTPLQAAIIALLAGRAAHTLITLTDFPPRENGREDDRKVTAGRRFVKAQQRLKHALQQAQVWDEVKITRLTAAGGAGRKPDLEHLVKQIFCPDFKPQPDAKPADGVLTLIEAPSAEEEVAAILRNVKRLLLTTDARPDDILIALRDWSRYRPHFSRYLREYGLPLVLHYGEPLGENPAIIALMNLLELSRQDFPRMMLLETLRSPYFEIPGLTSEDVDVLERISRHLLITSGREAWLNAIKDAYELRLNEQDDDLLLEDEARLIDYETCARLWEHLANFFDAVTPPEYNQVADYVHWLDVLIGRDDDHDPDDDGLQLPASLETYTLKVARRAKQQPRKTGIVERDVAALYEFKRVLRALLSAQELLHTLGEDPQVPWETFHTDLKAAVETTPINSLPMRTGCVLVTTANDARGLPHKHVFIPGLSEGIFPAQMPEDPLYLDSERRKLGEALDVFGKVVETTADKAADDGVFYELVSLARESLTLSRPVVKDGTPWPSSHLWRAVLAVYPAAPLRRYGAGTVVAAEEAASVSEALLAAAAEMNARMTSSLHAWLAAQHPTLWSHVRAARAVERRRMSRAAAFDHYSGRLADAALIAYVENALGDNRAWSATQLNDYGQCPFRFFSKHLLKLEALKDPEIGMDALQLGRLNHEILEATYRRIADQDLLIAPENADAAVAILHEVAAELLPDAPQRLGFRASSLWAQEQAILLRRLVALVRQDFEDCPIDREFKGDLRRPYRFELPFGFKANERIDLGDGLKIRVRGVIDRIDLQNDRAIIIDYKASAGISLEEMEAGRNFQMMVYLLAAEQVLDFEARGGLFWGINARKISGTMHRDNPDHEEVLATARAYVAENIRAGRRGDFATRANTETGRGPCSKYCDFHQFCRHSITAKREKD